MELRSCILYLRLLSCISGNSHVPFILYLRLLYMIPIMLRLWAFARTSLKRKTCRDAEYCRIPLDSCIYCPLCYLILLYLHDVSIHMVESCIWNGHSVWWELYANPYIPILWVFIYSWILLGFHCPVKSQPPCFGGLHASVSRWPSLTASISVTMCYQVCSRHRTIFQDKFIMIHCSFSAKFNLAALSQSFCFKILSP